MNPHPRSSIHASQVKLSARSADALSDVVARFRRLGHIRARLRVRPDAERVVAVTVALALLMAVALSLVGVGMVARLNVTTPATTPATTSATIPTWARAQPAIRSDFADPAVLVVGNTYYAYATNAYGKHIQVARSLDLREWTLLPDALPVLPAWADSRGDWVWAPAVLQVGQRFLMYYTARDAASAHQCIGVATSASPIGPFTDHNVQPLICQLSLGGSIDPAPFRDGSALYLYFKSDGNCCRQLTHLWGQRLTPDGLALVDSPVSLLTNDQPWEGNVVEAPNMLAHDGQYDLFYSANDYATDRYAVGYARCQTPLGPCVKTTDKPLLASAPMSPEQLSGPGGGAFFEAAGATWIAFHAWNLESSGSVRSLMIERLGWRGDTPVVPAPATSPLRSSA